MDIQEVLRTELAAIFLDAVEDPDVLADEEILARYVLGRLAAQGWQITRGDGLVPVGGPGLCERCGTAGPAVRP
jgi:hypothetical protein